MRYATACDTRDWQLFERVFHPQVIANYNDEFKQEGRPEVVGLIKSMLGVCGPTQHLLGNFHTEVNGDQADCRCYVRAAHVGAPGSGKEDLYYEIWAEYRSQLGRFDNQWLITRHELWLFHETGSREVLQP